MVRPALVVLRWKIKSRYVLDVPAVRGIFHWQYSGVVIPLFFATGVAMALASQFAMSYLFFVLFGAWSALYWLTSDALAERRRALRSRDLRRREKELRNQRRAYGIRKWGVSVMLVAISIGFIFWTRGLEKEVPRAYLHVDDVSVEIQTENGFPLYLVAHIKGHNVSASVATGPNPIVTACIRVRPFIESTGVEKTLFASDGCWVGSSYMGLNHVLNPLEQFSFSKTEYLAFLGGQDPNNPFSFETAKKIQKGELVIYVVTRALYCDRWGGVQRNSETESCSVFSALDGFRKGMCWGQYQQ
jgi:hypothetical protein